MSKKREGLNEKGQLLPGYRFVKGGKVVKIKSATKKAAPKTKQSAMKRRSERLAKRRAARQNPKK